MNSVKLYSNGSAVITKGYPLPGEGSEPLKVSIPVKKADLDDVVSSISVSGDVTMPEPPNYTPTNSDPTTLELDGENVLKELATKLRGSEVEITTNNQVKTVGKLFGIQNYQQEVNGSIFDKFRILLGTDAGIRQFDETEVSSLKFKDEFVQSEIDKSLAACFSKIKPDSRNIDLTIVPNGKADFAAISYATPCAAWKIRYQLRLLKGVATLEQQAVVDNDTDDDWKDVQLSVITGEPISFSTDIADIRRPTRSRVNVVSDTTTGAVQAEETVLGTAYTASTRSAKSAMRSMSMSPQAACFDGALENCVEGASGPRGSYGAMGVAPIQAAEVRESGDFSVFTAPNPVTILSRRSAIIGLANLPLEDAKTVLLYKPTKNTLRPFTAIKFKNTTSCSLGKGVCEVYVDGDRQGKCVLETTKQGEEAFLVHAVETGVKVFPKTGNVESRRIGVKISDNIVYCEELSTQQTSYRIQNSKAEDFQFEIEHSRQWTGSKLTVDVGTSVETPSGCRVNAVLPSNGTLVVVVTETLVQKNQHSIDSRWLQQNFIFVDHPLGRNKGIQAVVEAQQAVDSVANDISELEQEVSSLTREQQRLITLIPNLHGEQANSSKNSLSESESRIQEVTKVSLPKLRKALKAAKENLYAVMSKLKTEWVDEDAPQEVNQNQDK
jgi:hypothetical protein